MSDPVEAGGPWVWLDKMAVDSDGTPDYAAYDPDWQAGTSLRWPDHTPLNADVIPYLAIGAQALRDMGARMGDLAYAIHSGTGASSPAVVGDSSGKGSKRHEGSMALARALGLDPSPRHGGADAEIIIYVLFPASGKATYYDGALADAEALYQGWGGASAAYAAVNRSQPSAGADAGSSDATASSSRPWWHYAVGAVGLLVIGGLVFVAVA